MVYTLGMYSQEYISNKQSIHLFGNGIIETNNSIYFNIKKTYVQQTNKKGIRVINVFDLNVETSDENVVSKMIFVNDLENPYLKYITIDLHTQDTATFIYYLEKQN